MKKTIALYFIAMFGIAVISSSCSKKGDYVCECTYSIAGMSSTQTPITNTTKSKAKSICQETQDQLNAASQTTGLGDVVSCELQ